MIHKVLVAGMLAAFLLPVQAATAERNEKLVMRLIFEDCLGFVRDGRTPFAGLPTHPASAAAIDGLPTRRFSPANVVELLSSRYVASWGENADSRHCFVGTVGSAEQDGLPALLGVAASGFLSRVTARARAAGLSRALVTGTFSPLSLSSWSEPGQEDNSGPRRPVSFSIIASTPVDAQGTADAGLILMAGPPGGRRR